MDAASRIIGTSAFKHVARAVLTFAFDGDGTRVLSQQKNNLGRSDIPSMQYRISGIVLETDDGRSSEYGKFVPGALTGRTVDEILAEAGQSADDKTAATEARRWLVDYLTAAGGYLAEVRTAKPAATAAGIAARTLERVRPGVADIIRSHTRPPQYFWSLKEHLRPQAGHQQPADSSPSGEPVFNEDPF